MHLIRFPVILATEPKVGVPGGSTPTFVGVLPPQTLRVAGCRGRQAPPELGTIIRNINEIGARKHFRAGVGTAFAKAGGCAPPVRTGWGLSVMHHPAVFEGHVETTTCGSSNARGAPWLLLQRLASGALAAPGEVRL